jgi:RNA polymerase sigma factor FliA
VDCGLVSKYTWLVKKIAYNLSSKLSRFAHLDDLIQTGMLGLLEALRSFDANKGASFETYASIRIRGFILDEVRKNDWVPRSVHKNSRLISSTLRILENRLGRDPKYCEIAEELGIALAEYHEMIRDSANVNLYGFDDIGVNEDNLSAEFNIFPNEPQTKVLNEDVKIHLKNIINNIPKKEKMVLSLYYDHDLNLKEISEILGVSESRVSQIHSQATSRIRKYLSHHDFT